MRKAIILLLLLLLVACGKAEEPLISELKGRWAMPNIIKASDEYRVQKVSNASKPDKDFCRIMHVAFTKDRVVMYTLGFGLTVFHIANFRREGARLILTGSPDGERNPAAQGELVLLLRDGEVRFDDLYDERGHSLRYERIPADHQMRKYGATNVGDAMKMFLDLKPCPTSA